MKQQQQPGKVYLKKKKKWITKSKGEKKELFMLVKTKESGEIFKCGNAERFKGENQGAKLVKEAMDVNIKKWQGNSKWGKKREREREGGRGKFSVHCFLNIHLCGCVAADVQREERKTRETKRKIEKERVTKCNYNNQYRCFSLIKVAAIWRKRYKFKSWKSNGEPNSIILF